MIRCLIVDDEPLALHILEDYISKIPFLQLVKATTNPIEALTLVQEKLVDLVFLDVQMPELTGIQFLRIANGKAKVILTTAFPQYALEGYELDIIDYLLKPFALSRFLKAVQKAKDYHEMKTRTSGTLQSSYIFIKSDKRIEKIELNDIIYAESTGNYVSIHTEDKR